MEKIGELISERRKELGLTLEEIGNIVGVGKSTVKKWESGLISNMRRDKISLLAKALQISPTKLIGEDSAPLESNISEIITTGIYNVPVFESVSAGFGAYACSDICDYIPVVINNAYDAENFIAIKVKGDSMYPKIEDGDTIVVRKQDSVDSHSIAVVMLDSEDAVVKKIVYGEDWVELRSINPEYKTRRFEGEAALQLRVVGLVKQVIKNL